MLCIITYLMMEHVSFAQTTSVADPLMHVLRRDMQTVGCLIVELVWPTIWTVSLADSQRGCRLDARSLSRRYELARRICRQHMHELPRFVSELFVYSFQTI